MAKPMKDYREILRGIRTFQSLIEFLREELDWPILEEDFEELTFDYSPEELGIDEANAAKIQKIKRLRPLSVNQPWGIFFVMFDPKRLPVVALRRILSRVVLKKRASANSAERASWQADDLLFVSNYGEGDERQISFAHFAQHGQKKDLPTLKVLGWDNLDTPLHLDYVAEELVGKLFWPDDPDDLEKWRRTWRSAFTLRHREVITTSRDLAVRLAELARAIRDRIKTVLAIETANGPLTKLMKAFQEALVHDLDADGFADMYAQTIAYGLLSARVENPLGKTADDLAAQMPVTNPFLKELMETFLDVGGRKGKVGRGPGLDFDELGVSEVVELLDAANMEAVVRDFGDLKPDEDPVIHFYELFLKEYDAKKKMQRGVFYTPRPVVSYIVRSVDELLRTEFGLADGLADTATWGDMAAHHPGLKIPQGTKPDEPFVQILDPATGTGTFLVEVIDLIHKTMTAKWQAAGHSAREIGRLWNDYVPKNLLPRLHGYELLMAPYAIAHMKIGLKLYETGYRFGSDERVRVYLTNALEPAQDFSGRLAFMIPALAHEAQAVNTIKHHQRFTVVIGNPPYSNFGQLNTNPFIMDLLNEYKRDLEEKKLNLDDDYVKFFRSGQHTIDQTGSGILGMITNSSYLDGMVHRKMRESLLNSFRYRLIIDLHGNSRRREVAPDGSKDENVFDIQQGVAVSLWAKCCTNGGAGLRRCDLWGERASKYQQLMKNTALSQCNISIESRAPMFFFIPQDESLINEYRSFWGIEKIFLVYSSGMTAERDHVAIHFTRSELEKVLRDFRLESVESLRKKYGLTKDSRDWTVAGAITDVRKNTKDDILIQKLLYRPFDYRFTWYSGISRGFVGTPVMLTGAHMTVRGNVAILAPRQTKENVGAFVTHSLAGHKSFSVYDRTSVFPLWLKGHDSEVGIGLFGKNQRLNIRSQFLDLLAAQLDIQPARGTVPSGLTSQDIFQYAYAVFYCPVYRSRYAEFLKIDFPRLPLTSSLELFRGLARLGGELVALHLVEAPVQQALSVRYDQVAKAWRYNVPPGYRLPVALTFTGPAAPVVEKVGWSNDTVWLDAVKLKLTETVTGTIGFHGVPEDVWNFHIGGYQVCQKWLKDRKGRTLSADDLTHYHRIVIALHETIRLMKEIDEVIDQHGGWPDAFAGGAPGHS